MRILESNSRRLMLKGTVAAMSAVGMAGWAKLGFAADVAVSVVPSGLPADD